MESCRIAIVDDHQIFVSLLEDYLEERPGYVVVGTAQNGKQALEVCSRTSPDMILIDMIMPGMSGPELIAELRRRHPQAKILAVSGVSSKEVINAAIKSGADGYFSKRRSIPELVGALDSIRLGVATPFPEEADALRWAVRQRRLSSELSLSDIKLLRLFLDELPVKEIAMRTERTPSAVYKALERLKRRLNVSSDWQLRSAAQRLGMDEGCGDSSLKGSP